MDHSSKLIDLIIVMLQENLFKISACDATIDRKKIILKVLRFIT